MEIPWPSEVNPGGEGPIAIFILDLKTHQISTLPRSDGFVSPRWSPDGSNVAASDGQRLVVFDFRTRTWADWAKFDALGAKNWSKDGKYLYFDADLKGETSFYRLRVSDHRVEQIVSAKGVGRQAFGTMGAWTGLAPDDSPLALRDVGTQEIYALDWEVPCPSHSTQTESS